METKIGEYCRNWPNTADVNAMHESGPSCVKKPKIKWESLQPFPVFRRIFLHAIMDKSAEGGLKSVRKCNNGAKRSSGK